MALFSWIGRLNLIWYIQYLNKCGRQPCVGKWTFWLIWLQPRHVPQSHPGPRPQHMPIHVHDATLPIWTGTATSYATETAAAPGVSNANIASQNWRRQVSYMFCWVGNPCNYTFFWGGNFPNKVRINDKSCYETMHMAKGIRVLVTIDH